MQNQFKSAKPIKIVCASNQPKNYKCPVLKSKRKCIENCDECYKNDLALYNKLMEL